MANLIQVKTMAKRHFDQLVRWPESGGITRTVLETLLKGLPKRLGWVNNQDYGKVLIVEINREPRAMYLTTLSWETQQKLIEGVPQIFV